MLRQSTAALQRRAAAQSQWVRRAATAASAPTQLDPEAMMHDSTIPTMHFQKSLPRLPIPELDSTLDKYLYFAEPVTSSDSFAKAKAHVEDFRRGVGPTLHEELVQTDKANPHTSYISEMWYDMYLRNRASFPINLTPQLTWMQDENPQKNEQAVKAANLVSAAVRYYRSLKANVLKPDVFALNPPKYNNPMFQRLVSLLPESVSYYAAYAVNAYPLDMSQYSRLFSSTRLPKLEKDELVSFEDSRHVIVLRGAKTYRVDVFDALGKPLEPDAIEGQMRGIIEASRGQTGKEPSVATLTGWDRDGWAKTREHMAQDSGNAASLAEVDSALFTLTLEDEAPETHEEIASVMLHGNCRNRWFDKSFNLIVCKNGRSGIIWEHAWGDGVAVLNFFNEVYREITGLAERPPAAPIPLAAAKGDKGTASNETAPQPTECAWHLDDTVQSDIAAAGKHNDSLINRLALNIFQSESLSKDIIKQSKFSPDGVMQMVLQLAHWHAHGYTPPTYESASTAGFKHGRTETIRSATPEAKVMCELLAPQGQGQASLAVDKDAQVEALRRACENHSRITRECLTGKGVDRHLFALNKYAEKHGMETPAMFNDDAWRTMQTIRLSTSTLASPALDGGGFGPVNDTSYGVGYGSAERGVHFSVCSFDNGNSDFMNAIEWSLQQVYPLLKAAKEKVPAQGS